MAEQTDLSKLFQALTFAAEKHSKQRRKDPEKSPYINHPIGVADIIIREGGVEDIDILQAAILHDSIEDTKTTEKELKDNFGENVTRIVLELTDDKSLSKKERKRLQIENARDKSYEAKIVGMADKINNLRDLNKSVPEGWTEKRVIEYFKWANKVVIYYYDANPSLAKILKKLFKDKDRENAE